MVDTYVEIVNACADCLGPGEGKLGRERSVEGSHFRSRRWCARLL